MQYAFDFNGQVFTPDGKVDLAPKEVPEFNKRLEKVELEMWAQKPDRWNVYIVRHEDPNMSHPRLTGPQHEVWFLAETYLGTRLSNGRVEHTVFSKRTKSRTNMVSIRFLGTNGATYYGRFNEDLGNLCRVRRTK